jgi:hypothetical protein
MLHRLTCDTLVKVCDQLSSVIAQAHISEDHETVDTVVPALVSLWQLRWELNITAGDVAGASREAVAREEIGGVS